MSVGQYNHLGNEIRVHCTFEQLAAGLVRENYGVHRILSHLVAEWRKFKENGHLKYVDDPDHIIPHIERMLDEGKF